MELERISYLNGQSPSDTLTIIDNIVDPLSIIVNYLIAGTIVIVTSLIFTMVEPKTCDWFLLPAIFCGVLIGSDVVAWFRGQIDPFDPKGLIGFVVFFGFFVAPILHVVWNDYDPYLRFHGDPRKWLLVATTANAMGLLVFKGAQHWAYRHTNPIQNTWEVVPQRILPIMALVMPVAFGTWLYFERLKWKRGVVEEFVLSHLAMQGSGWLLIFGGEFMAVLLLMGLISRTMAKRMDRSWKTCAFIFLVGVVGQLFLTVFSGIRGLILQGIFWIAGLIHYYWRRVSPTFLLIGLICFLPFMYFYSFYKDLMQPGMLTSLTVIKQSKELERETGRTFHRVLLSDLARADVQARIASGVMDPGEKYDLMYGRTYLFALSKLIPATIRQLLFEEPSFLSWSKGKAFIDLNEGKGFVSEQANWGTNAFGLGGEAMLNFGLLGVPVAWLVFGLVLGIFRHKRDTLHLQDARWALVPFLSYWLAITPLWDLDVLVFQTVTGGFIPFLCILLWSRKIKNREI